MPSSEKKTSTKASHHLDVSQAHCLVAPQQDAALSATPLAGYDNQNPHVSPQVSAVKGCLEVPGWCDSSNENMSERGPNKTPPSDEMGEFRGKNGGSGSVNGPGGVNRQQYYAVAPYPVGTTGQSAFCCASEAQLHGGADNRRIQWGSVGRQGALKSRRSREEGCREPGLWAASEQQQRQYSFFETPPSLSTRGFPDHPQCSRGVTHEMVYSYRSLLALPEDQAREVIRRYFHEKPGARLNILSPGTGAPLEAEGDGKSQQQYMHARTVGPAGIPYRENQENAQQKQHSGFFPDNKLPNSKNAGKNIAVAPMENTCC